ncbi:hypothetical protein DID78_02130, partial [Candidatus Marinamargulisbacteria bacterium SCGC AG-343-D04]
PLSTSSPKLTVSTGSTVISGDDGVITVSHPTEPPHRITSTAEGVEVSTNGDVSTTLIPTTRGVVLTPSTPEIRGNTSIWVCNFSAPVPDGLNFTLDGLNSTLDVNRGSLFVDGEGNQSKIMFFLTRQMSFASIFGQLPSMLENFGIGFEPFGAIEGEGPIGVCKPTESDVEEDDGSINVGIIVLIILIACVGCLGIAFLCSRGRRDRGDYEVTNRERVDLGNQVVRRPRRSGLPIGAPECSIPLPRGNAGIRGRDGDLAGVIGGNTRRTGTSRRPDHRRVNELPREPQVLNLQRREPVADERPLDRSSKVMHSSGEVSRRSGEWLIKSNAIKRYGVGVGEEGLFPMKEQVPTSEFFPELKMYDSVGLDVRSPQKYGKSVYHLFMNSVTELQIESATIEGLNPEDVESVLYEGSVGADYFQIMMRSISFLLENEFSSKGISIDKPWFLFDGEDLSSLDLDICEKVDKAFELVFDSMYSTHYNPNIVRNSMGFVKSFSCDRGCSDDELLKTSKQTLVGITDFRLKDQIHAYDDFDQKDKEIIFQMNKFKTDVLKEAAKSLDEKRMKVMGKRMEIFPQRPRTIVEENPIKVEFKERPDGLKSVLYNNFLGDGDVDSEKKKTRIGSYYQTWDILRGFQIGLDLKGLVVHSFLTESGMRCFLKEENDESDGGKLYPLSFEKLYFLFLYTKNPALELQSLESQRFFDTLKKEYPTVCEHFVFYKEHGLFVENIRIKHV